MYRLSKLIHIFLLSTFLITQSFATETQTSLPAQAVQVTPEEFKDLKKDEVKPGEARKSQTELPGPIDFLFRGGGGGNGKDAAILIFAVVGTVVLVAWIPYTALLVYRAIKKPENFKVHSLLEAQFIYLSPAERKGFIGAIQYTPFLIEKSSAKKSNYGLNFEIGNYHFKDSGDLASVKYNSFYWLIGPSIVFGNLDAPGKAVFAKLDLMAGTSFSRDVKLMLKADISFQFIPVKKFFYGVGFGADYMDGQKGKGIVTHIDNLKAHFLLTTGVRF